MVLEAVKQNGLALKYVHDELKKDLEVVVTAVKQNTDALKLVREEIKQQVLELLEGVLFGD